MNKNLRLIAANIINEVGKGRSLADSLNLHFLDKRDKAWVQAICFGVCRFYTRLDVMLSYLLEKPLKANQGDIHALLLIGIYQLWAMRVPSYAAVTETVNAVKKPWARGLVNAVLRQFSARLTELLEKIKYDDEAKYAHPQWLIDEIKNNWPADCDAILNANNEHPPFALRVNLQKISRDEYQKKLVKSEKISQTKTGIILDQAIQVDELPGFAAGEVSVQDGAAQLAASFLPIKANQRILDACAAPGGKLNHLLEIEPSLEIVGIEKEKSRLTLIKENVKRLNQTPTLILSDANDVETWWDGKLFDNILLDAPCSGSGVIRRHPDIKLLRQHEDIKNLAQEQKKLLKTLWPLLKPGGFLLYVTCSVFSAENSEVITDFLAFQTDAKVEEISIELGIKCIVGMQILPGMYQMDGFYFALISKT